MPIDKEKTRLVTIPIQIYRSVKRTAAETDKTMNQLLADAWKNYEQKVVES